MGVKTSFSVFHSAINTVVVKLKFSNVRYQYENAADLNN
jgi:hypothetical protein